jgi:hypothetical protein
VLLRVDVLAPDDILRDYGPGALLRWERGDAVGGPFVEQGTQAVVTGKYQHEINDPTGTNAHYYRTRFSDSIPSFYSPYSNIFRGGVPDTYATVDETLLGFESNISGDTKKVARLTMCLQTATRELTRDTGFSFFRSPPVSGTEVRYVDGDGSNKVHVHAGIIPGSITEIAIAGSYGDVYQVIGATDYLTEPQVTSGADEAIYHLILSPLGTLFQSWPEDIRIGRITAAFQYETPPDDIRQACIDRARQLYEAAPTPAGGTPSGEEYGRPVSFPRKPDTYWSVVQAWKGRFAACHIW